MPGSDGFKSKAQVLRDRGIALLVVGAIPLLAGLIGFRGESGEGYRALWVQACLVGGLALVGLGVVLIDRANRAGKG